MFLGAAGVEVIAGVEGKAGQAVIIHHMDDQTVLQTMAKQQGQGYSNLNDATDTLLANAEKESANVERNLAKIAKRAKASSKKEKAQEKAAAYCGDQRGLALMIADVLCNPVKPQVPSNAGLRDDLLVYSNETTILREKAKRKGVPGRLQTLETDRIKGTVTILKPARATSAK